MEKNRFSDQQDAVEYKLTRISDVWKKKTLNQLKRHLQVAKSDGKHCVCNETTIILWESNGQYKNKHHVIGGELLMKLCR